MITTGNKPNGWFVGHFIESNDLRHQENIEIKWASHKKGDKKEGWTASRQGITISILIRGVMKSSFIPQPPYYTLKWQEGLGLTIFCEPPRANDIREVTLKEEGDYVMWEAETFHTWEIMEDATILTVRLPSEKENERYLQFEQ